MWQRIKNNSLLFSFVALAFFALGLLIGQNVEVKQSAPAAILNSAGADQILRDQAVPLNIDQQQVDFNLFWKVWNSLRERYYRSGQITTADLFYGSIKGMVASVGDPYTVFFNPKEATEFNNELQGKFEGIGAEIGIKHDRLTVIAPLPGSPAERAGLRPGDFVVAINGEETTDLFLDEAVQRIRGPQGTTVTLTLFREEKPPAFDRVITREQIEINTVSSKWLGQKQNVVYIKIYSFNEDTATDFQTEVNRIVKKAPAGIILDLRSNPGGYLDVAVEMASYWINDGVVVTEKFADGKEQVYRSHGYAKFAGIPTVVLVNGGSASASEIVAGALSDHDQAVILGEQTFGKGSVQDYSLLDGGAALKITVAEWLTPNGDSINENGITPEVEIKITSEDFNNDLDPQLKRAVELLE